MKRKQKPRKPLKRNYPIEFHRTLKIEDRDYYLFITTRYVERVMAHFNGNVAQTRVALKVLDLVHSVISSVPPSKKGVPIRSVMLRREVPAQGTIGPGGIKITVGNICKRLESWVRGEPYLKTPSSTTKQTPKHQILARAHKTLCPLIKRSKHVVKDTKKGIEGAPKRYKLLRDYSKKGKRVSNFWEGLALTYPEDVLCSFKLPRRSGVKIDDLIAIRSAHSLAMPKVKGLAHMFVLECCLKGQKERVRRPDLWAAYKSWGGTLRQKEFFSAIQRQFGKPAKIGGIMFFKGLDLA